MLNLIWELTGTITDADGERSAAVWKDYLSPTYLGGVGPHDATEVLGILGDCYDNSASLQTFMAALTAAAGAGSEFSAPAATPDTTISVSWRFMAVDTASGTKVVVGSFNELDGAWITNDLSTVAAALGLDADAVADLTTIIT